MLKGIVNIHSETFNLLGLCCYQLLKKGDIIDKHSLTAELKDIQKVYVCVMGEWYNELNEAFEILMQSEPK